MKSHQRRELRYIACKIWSNASRKWSCHSVVQWRQVNSIHLFYAHDWDLCNPFAFNKMKKQWNMGLARLKRFLQFRKKFIMLYMPFVDDTPWPIGSTRAEHQWEYPGEFVRSVFPTMSQESGFADVETEEMAQGLSSVQLPLVPHGRRKRHSPQSVDSRGDATWPSFLSVS